MRSGAFLATVGRRVRATREERGWSRRELSERSGVSERFLAQLETGRGNISEVAAALGTTPAELLSGATGRDGARPIALLGVRGAGKSTIGMRLARRLGVPFVEVDQRIEQTAGLRLGEIFELHGEAYYRRLEREVLARLFADGDAMVVATGGSIVNDPANFALLAERARTVWLRAAPEDHWERVVRQGDRRPMQGKQHAFAELRALLAAREGLYARAQHVVDTSGRSVDDVVDEVAAAVTPSA
jgi:XRE family transcriptional regulator, aerobic/anaerobic benzoate catabolism transcriptional regulator